MNGIFLLFFVMMIAAQPAYGEEPASAWPDETTRLMDAAKRYPGKMAKPEITPESRRRAEAIKKSMESGEYKSKIREAEKEIVKTLTGKDLPDLEPAMKTKTPSSAERLAADERIYLFVSSSLPLPVLRAYAAGMERLKEPRSTMVLRGIKGKNIRETMDFLMAVMQIDSSCDWIREKCAMRKANIVIDPLLYRKYGITRVPAVVFAKGVKLADSEMSEGMANNANVSEWHVIYGDATLGYLLETLGKEESAAGLARLAESIR